MVLAFLLWCDWLILVPIVVILALLAFPGTRRYVKAMLSSVRIVLMVFLFGAFLVASSVAIYGDVHYFVNGRETEAVITKVVREGKNRHVEYEFTEADGTPRTGSDAIDTNWVAPANGKLSVQYLPGEEGASRLQRLITHWLPYVLFVISACLLPLIIAMGVRGVMKATQTGI